MGWKVPFRIDWEVSQYVAFPSARSNVPSLRNIGVGTTMSLFDCLTQCLCLMTFYLYLSDRPHIPTDPCLPFDRRCAFNQGGTVAGRCCRLFFVSGTGRSVYRLQTMLRMGCGNKGVCQSDASDIIMESCLPLKKEALCCFRDGLERVEVGDDASVADVWAAVAKALSLASDQMALSKDPKLVCSPHNHCSQVLNLVCTRYDRLGIPPSYAQ